MTLLEFISHLSSNPVSDSTEIVVSFPITMPDGVAHEIKSITDIDFIDGNLILRTE